ncbi:2-C-methyl-D-erythritol 4-phosphate cytidylyltransferase [filamentous cyanobacterium CCP5]|nr:2-C-methyl-D-erythritol 4-phosphate cytidylyltransferase [filamentous cyanobacterium CCP5]
MHFLIPAAGMGRRMGADRNKVLITLLNRPLIAWTLLAADRADGVSWIGLVCQSGDRPLLADIVESLPLTTPVALIQGGDSRQQSVYNGLQGLPPGAKRVLIHDGARCLATPELFNRCGESLKTVSGLIAAVPVKDTIKVVNDRHQVQSTPDRSRLWAAQTPQGFEVDLLKQCHEKGLQQGWNVTDDAALFEQCELPVQIVPGEETNIKVTTPDDLAIAELILRQRGGPEGL